MNYLRIQFFSVLMAIFVLSSCGSEIEMDQFSGTVFAYSEVAGEKFDINDLSELGIPQSEKDVIVLNRALVTPIAVEGSFIHSNSDEPYEITSGVIGIVQTDVDGHYFLEAEINPNRKDHKTVVKLILDESTTYPSGDILSFKNRKVEVEFTDIAFSHTVDIKLTIEKDYLSESEEERSVEINLSGLDLDDENGIMTYEREVFLMENINLNYTYSIDNGEEISGQFFTGDDDNPGVLRVDI